MSYMQRPPNGYGNGGEGSHLRRFDLDLSSRDTSADERSRSRGPGGYGGFGQQREQVRGPARLDRGNAQRKSRDYDRSASRSKSRPAAGGFGGLAGNQQVEEILRYIEQHWSFMANDTCIPIKVALQLMDPSSLGLADQYEGFQDAHQQLQDALKVIVNEHHQGFNSSIGTFHKIQAAIHASQQKVRMLRSGLVQAQGSLAIHRPELKAFSANSQNYDSMLQVLGTIEQLQLVPERLEAQISEKRFLGAVDALQEALKLIRKPELEHIGALSELRVYLSNQEHSLTDILVEELHSHLYLKSPYCEERWKAHMKKADSGNNSAMYYSDELRAMHRFLEAYDGTNPMQEDSTRNPEADTFYYIQLLVESLNKMSKLDEMVDEIEQRLPVELFKLVERSHSEVEQRHPSSLRMAARNRQQGSNVDEGPDSERRATLEDLLTTLYAKFEAIAEGHRILHDVTGAILKREAQPGAAGSNRSFRELWKLLQSEIRSLLHDHLASNGNMGGRTRQDNVASSNIFRPQPRDRNRKMFKLSDTLGDDKSNDLATEREDLEFILKSSVPGLVNSSAANASRTSKERDDNAALSDRSATGHKLLLEPSVFNMSILLPPSLAFLSHLREVVPQNSGVVPSTLTAFLDDFLINVFYPQLDETLMDLCARSMDADAFLPHPSWSAHASKPIFKGTVRFYEVLESVCKMLDELPHEQGFAQLVVHQIRTYYDRCYSWSKSLLQRIEMSQQENPDTKMRLGAELATSGDINDVVVSLMQATPDSQDEIVLAEKESALLLRHVKTRHPTSADLLHDRKTLAALCTLHTSLKWLTTRLQTLRFISPLAVDTTEHHPHTASTPTRRWTAPTSSPTPLPTTPYLPLDPTTAIQFDAVTTSLTSLAALLLRTLHLDLRLHTLHALYTTLDTSHDLSHPPTDPSAPILALTAFLSTHAAHLTTHLPATAVRFLTHNLHVLANSALVGLVGSIPALDAHGLARLQLDVLVLQQGLKVLQPAAELGRAARFYALGAAGPGELVEKGVGQGFALEEVKGLVRLVWDGGERELEEVLKGL